MDKKRHLFISEFFILQALFGDCILKFDAQPVNSLNGAVMILGAFTLYSKVSGGLENSKSRRAALDFDILLRVEKDSLDG